MSQATKSVYNNPGDLFVQNFGLPQELEDVLKYARWLRAEASLSQVLRLNLAVIYSHFGIPTPKRAPLPGQQGLLLNSDIGLVLINQDDPYMRQRFTEAHELMEFLFEAAAKNEQWRERSYIRRKPETKEQWCDQGASELLMPLTGVKPEIQKTGVSFHTARRLAGEFQVSLTASLWQMIKASENQHAIVRWRTKHKPKELQTVAGADKQMTLFGDAADLLPKKQLRVEWSISNSQSVFFPINKSIDEDTAVYAAWRDGVFTNGVDMLALGQRAMRFNSENQPFDLDDERQVISLITIL
jgi:hypothetical protein